MGRLQKQTVPSKSLLPKFFSLSWKIFVAFAIVLGVAVALKPNISVTPTIYLDPGDPLKALFDVTNNGFIPLYNVQASCAIIQVDYIGGYKITGPSSYKGRLASRSHHSKELSSGETDTVICELGALWSAPVVTADIAIVVDYSFLGIKCPSKIYPFTTQADSNGQLHWIKHPVKK